MRGPSLLVVALLVCCALSPTGVLGGGHSGSSNSNNQASQTTFVLIIVGAVVVVFVCTLVCVIAIRVQTGRQPYTQDEMSQALLNGGVHPSIYSSVSSSVVPPNSPYGPQSVSFESLKDPPQVQTRNSDSVAQVEPGTLKLAKKIGTGSYSDVWMAKWGQHTVAVKKFDAGAEDGRKEGELLARLSHPNVVRLLAVWEEGDNFGLLLPLATHGSLFEVLYRKKMYLSSRQRLDLCRGILAGLIYLHDNDVIHRDIKPENILIDSNLTPQLTDFNVSIQRPDVALTMQGTITGTCCYMSPELFTKDERANYSSQSDIYSFTMLMYDVFTGTRPFYGTDLMTNEWLLAESVRNGVRPTLPPGFDRTLERLMMRGWNSVPRERPTARQMAQFFDQKFYKNRK